MCSTVFIKRIKAAGLNTSGAGLGLHICKVLVNLSGGKIWAASRAGEYTEFLFTLPAGQKLQKRKEKGEREKAWPERQKGGMEDGAGTDAAGVQ